MTGLLVVLMLLLGWPALVSAQYTGFTLPNSPSAAFRDQARIFEQTWQTLAAASKNNGVVSGCAVTAQGSPNMTVHVAAGTIAYNGADVSVSAADATITAANASQPRIDLVSVNSAGTIIVTAGTPAAAGSTLAPTIPVTGSTPNVPLALVYVPAAATLINANDITSQAVFVLGNSPTFGGTVTGGTLATSGACVNQAALGAATFGLIIRCCDCVIGTTTCTAGGDGTVAIGVNASSPVWRCY